MLAVMLAAAGRYQEQQQQRHPCVRPLRLDAPPLGSIEASPVCEEQRVELWKTRWT